MAVITVDVTGPAPVETAWQRYLHPQNWTDWAPHLTRVRASTRTIRPGTTGTVTALGVVPARFTVLSVDPDNFAWAWTVWVGPIRLDLHHDLVAGDNSTLARIRLVGPRPVLLAYRPLMRWAMRRLVSDR
ncbi:SRPBCC family protein [Corynebacterium hylobatis]|uniref:SRPBCC family protein n=1 Tax=Corynebacterium hylobatis TaxID=1859290 RepID=A0A3S0BJB6_9CORY|nr:SRPBCC family protein [Corynebacterium hylobatis]RSZ65562.1 SRPBCC family protein [Corynebacterium hylobatis]